MIKTLSKLGVGGEFLNTIKALYEKPLVSIMLNGVKAFPLRPGTRQGCSFSSLIVSVFLVVLAKTTRQEK